MQRAQIRPVSLEHRGTVEQLNDTFDDPNDPKRFFKIPREKECTLHFFSPVPVAAASDIVVRLVGSRGERFPSGHNSNNLSTGDFVTLASGKQYELLRDHIGDNKHAPSYTCQVVLSPNSGRGAQEFSLKFSIDIATEDPREWHYYVFFHIVDRRTSIEGISPPMATKKRMAKPIEQGKWKSNIELFGMTSFSSATPKSMSKLNQTSMTSEWTFTSAAPQHTPSTPPVAHQQPQPQMAMQQQHQYQFVNYAPSPMQQHPQMMMMSPYANQGWYQPQMGYGNAPMMMPPHLQQGMPMQFGSPMPMMGGFSPVPITPQSPLSSVSQNMAHSISGSTSASPQSSNPASPVDDMAVVIPAAVPSGRNSPVGSSGRSKSSNALAANTRPYPTSGKAPRRKGSPKSSDSDAEPSLTLRVGPGCAPLGSHAVSGANGTITAAAVTYIPIKFENFSPASSPSSPGSTTSESDYSIGDIPVEILRDSNQPAGSSSSDLNGGKVKIDEENLSYAIHGACWKQQTPVQQLDVKINGESVGKVNVEWEQELLDHMEDWIRDMGQGKQRSLTHGGRYQQQDRNQQALLSEIKQLWEAEEDNDTRRMINYFVTVALNDLEFHRKRDSYAMFITRLSKYAEILSEVSATAETKDAVFRSPRVRAAYHELWVVINAEATVAYHWGYKQLLSMFTRNKKFDAGVFEKLAQLLHPYCAQHWASFNILVTLGACVPTVHERGPRRQMRRIYKELQLLENQSSTEGVGESRDSLDAGTLVFLFATDQYKHNVDIPETKSCVSDAKRLYTILTEKTFQCRAHTTFNRNFTKESFEEFLHYLPSIIKPGLQVLLCIHSHAMREAGDTFVCPWDADPAHLSRSAISLNALRDRLRDILGVKTAKGVHIALYLDTCHSGLTDDVSAASGTGRGGPAADDHVSDSITLEENSRQSSFEQIGASGSNQKALEKEPYGSYLTYAFATFLDNLRADAGFFEAFKHMKAFVSGKTGESQVPVYSRFTSGDGQFRFVTRSTREQRLVRVAWPRNRRVWQLGVPFVGDHYKMFFALFSETMEGSKTINRNVKSTIMQKLHLDDERDLEYSYRQISLPSGRVPDKIEQYGDITTFIDSKTSMIHIRAPEMYRVFFLKVQADLSCHDTIELQGVRCIRYCSSQIFSSGSKTPPALEQAAALVDGQLKGRKKECIFAWCVRQTKPTAAPAAPAGVSSRVSKDLKSTELPDDASVPLFECIDLKRMFKNEPDMSSYRYEEVADIGFLKGHMIVAINAVRADDVPECILFKLSWNNDGRVDRQLFKKLPVPVQKISYGQLHICLLSKLGDSIHCFGANNEHQLGCKNPSATSLAKSNVLFADAEAGAAETGAPTSGSSTESPKRTFVDIASGEIHNLALTSDGRVWSWGGNASGQLGRKKSEDAREIPDLRGVRHISCGSFSSACTTSVGAPKVWGFGKAEGLLRQQYSPRTLTLPLRKGICVDSVLLGTTSALVLESEDKPQLIDSKDKEEALSLDTYSPVWKMEKHDGFSSWKSKLTIRNNYTKSSVMFAIVGRLTNAVLHVESVTASRSGRYYVLPPGEKHKFKFTLVPLPARFPTSLPEYVGGNIILQVRGSLAYAIHIPEQKMPCGTLALEVVQRFPNLLTVDQIGSDETDMIVKLGQLQFPHLNVVGFLQAHYCVREKLRPLSEIAEPGNSIYKRVKSLLKVANVIGELEAMNICCRDLSLENIVLNGNDQPLLQSLQNSVELGRKDKVLIDLKMLNSTLRTLPPETFTSKKASGSPSMIFSFGILIYEILSSKRVVRSKANLQEGIVSFEDDDPRAATWNFRYLYRACCSPSKERRPSLSNVVSALQYHADMLKEDSKNLHDPLIQRRNKRAAASDASRSSSSSGQRKAVKSVHSMTSSNPPSASSHSAEGSTREATMDGTDAVSISESAPNSMQGATLILPSHDKIVDSVTEGVRNATNNAFVAAMELHTIGPINFSQYLAEVRQADLSWTFLQRSDRVDIKRETDSEKSAAMPLVSHPSARRIVVNNTEAAVAEKPPATDASQPAPAPAPAPKQKPAAPTSPSRSSSSKSSKKHERSKSSDSKKLKTKSSFKVYSASDITPPAVSAASESELPTSSSSSRARSKSSLSSNTSKNRLVPKSPRIAAVAAQHIKPGNEISGEEDEFESPRTASLGATTLSESSHSESDVEDVDSDFDPNEFLLQQQTKQQQPVSPLPTPVMPQVPSMPPASPGVFYMYMPVPVYSVMDASGQQRFVPLSPTPYAQAPGSPMMFAPTQHQLPLPPSMMAQQITQPQL
eukprot:TRINITY_DN2051_c0_g1_i1.p1 TRINITY_DN2051_c0_g1~~TRINITY_DN2051_c0_g1_i1.p1  ORF type:complete len:2287 (+),score=477.69 TRINITY_DN2051_c0_g1_i1:121-6981(+)